MLTLRTSVELGCSLNPCLRIAWHSDHSCLDQHFQVNHKCLAVRAVAGHKGAQDQQTFLEQQYSVSAASSAGTWKRSNSSSCDMGSCQFREFHLLCSSSSMGLAQMQCQRHLRVTASP